MKIIYLLFAFLFLAFLSEPGNAQPVCYSRRGSCLHVCLPPSVDLHRLDCRHGWTCCRPHYGK
ncbi:crotamine-like [Pantherophis guttatus]|uniref:Crotamine-like n=1 Tax=Pantherophis guttatus TaxID=94885 RepID=A0ABM3ZIE4_PANGU|nr:crotamine-like [Pantherophis guttatus]